MKITIDSIEKNEDMDSLHFKIRGDREYGLDKSIINGIRRIIIEEIPTCGFNFDENLEDKDILIDINNTSLHNEMILHRVSLMTLYINPEDKNKYLFKLHMKHDTNEPYNFVDSNDFDIYKMLPDKLDLNKMDDKNYSQDKLTQGEKDKILRPYVFRGKKNYSLLTELKNTHTGITHQEIKLYGSPSINIGKYNAGYQSSSRVSYSFLIDDDLVRTKLEDKMRRENISEEDKQSYAKRFVIEEAERYYSRDAIDEPFEYNFDIESQHYYDSCTIFITALDILTKKLSYLKEQFIYLLKDEPSSVSIEKSKEFVYVYTINDENHTIGNILQSHIVRRSIDNDSIINGCSYKKLHPLDESIILTLSINPSNKIYKKSEQQKIQQLTEFVRTQLDEIKNDIIDISKVARKKF